MRAGKQAPAEWFPRLFLGASFGSQNLELNGIGAGRRALHQRAPALLAMPIFNAGRTQRHQRDRRERSERSSAALRGRHRACTRGRRERAGRARDERQRSRSLADRRARPPKPRSAARSRSTTADRSTFCRCSMRSARASPCASARTTPAPSCCSTACNSTRRSAAAGRCSSLSLNRPSAATAPTPNIMNPSSQRGTVVKTISSHGACSPHRSPRCWPAARTSRRRARCAPFARSRSATTRRRKRIATSAPCSRATRSTRPSASAARSCSRKVDVGQKVRQGDVIAVLDDTDLQARGGGRATAAGRPPRRRHARPNRIASVWML